MTISHFRVRDGASVIELNYFETPSYGTQVEICDQFKEPKQTAFSNGKMHFNYLSFPIRRLPVNKMVFFICFFPIRQGEFVFDKI
jgi:hypothetical protein